MASGRNQLRGVLADLNDAQRQAVSHPAGPLLVIAGPGSGKTRVITRRAAYLVHTGTGPQQILAITFTNKAVDELRRRIEALGVRAGMWIYTFHALGVRLLREFGHLVQIAPGFSIYDEDDAVRTVKEAQEQEGVSASYLRPELARVQISRAKNRLWTPVQYEAAAENTEARTLARVYHRYQALLKQYNAVDFDDLLMLVALVLMEHPDVAERLSVRFRHVLVDEYQDTNRAQYVIARQLAAAHGNICVTGDPDQSIYAWRGADLRNILEFERDFPEATVVRLEHNYRSTAPILAVAGRLIRANTQRRDKALLSMRGAGPPVRLWRFPNDGAEAEHVARTIRTQHEAGRAYSDFAIMYRVNAISRGLEEALRHESIPYRVARGVEFYNRREIRDVLAYLRVLVNPADDVALLRIINTPTRGIGATTVARLQTRANEEGRPLREIVAADASGRLGRAGPRVQEFAALLAELDPLRDAPPSEAVSQVLERSGLEADLRMEREQGGEDRLANVQELVTAARRYERKVAAPTLADFLAGVALVSDQDAIDESAGCVMLMTLHAAKGLEFPVVFVVALEEEILPHDRALQDGDVEEERRLCFVGLTRARDELTLSWCDHRTFRGRVKPQSCSQFIRELDDGSAMRQDFRRGYRASGADEGFEPVLDDLPPEEAARYDPAQRLRHRGWRAAADGASEEVAAPRGAPSATGGAFDEWKVGTLVQHDEYGVGQVTWIQPTSGQTRAGVLFAGRGEITVILEYAGLRRLARGVR